MKNIFLLLCITILITGCGTNSDGETMVEESVEIFDGYVDTLETSIQDAKEVKVLMDDRQNLYK